MAISYRNISPNINNFDGARVYKYNTTKIIHYNCSLKCLSQVLTEPLMSLTPWHAVKIGQWWKIF